MAVRRRRRKAVCARRHRARGAHTAARRQRRNDQRLREGVALVDQATADEKCGIERGAIRVMLGFCVT